MIIVTIESGIVTGVYENRAGEHGLAIVVDLDARDAGDEPVGVYDVEPYKDLPADIKRLIKRHEGMVDLAGGAL